MADAGGAYGEVRWSPGREGPLLDDRPRTRSSCAWPGSTWRRRSRDPATAGIPWDVEEFDLSDDGRTIALVANEDGVARLHVLDAETGRRAPGADAAGRGDLGPGLPPGSRRSGFTLSSARSPSDAYSCDLDSGKVERWTHERDGGARPGGVPRAGAGPVPELRRPRRSRRSSTGPARSSTGPRPVLIEIHGGPEGQFRPAFLGRADFLVNELGIAVIFPNVRGSSGYGKTYLKLDNGAKRREDAVKDIGALLDWIARQPDLDATRVAVIGRLLRRVHVAGDA